MLVLIIEHLIVDVGLVALKFAPVCKGAKQCTRMGGGVGVHGCARTWAWAWYGSYRGVDKQMCMGMCGHGGGVGVHASGLWAWICKDVGMGAVCEI